MCGVERRDSKKKRTSGSWGLGLGSKRGVEDTMWWRGGTKRKDILIMGFGTGIKKRSGRYNVVEAEVEGTKKSGQSKHVCENTRGIFS